MPGEPHPIFFYRTITPGGGVTQVNLGGGAHTLTLEYTVSGKNLPFNIGPKNALNVYSFGPKMSWSFICKK